MLDVKLFPHDENSESDSTMYRRLSTAVDPDGNIVMPEKDAARIIRSLLKVASTRECNDVELDAFSEAALSTAVSMLEQGCCPDAVSRQYLVDISYYSNHQFIVNLSDIQDAPAVVMPRQKGTWIEHSEKGYQCPFCRNEGNLSHRPSNFCPDCGAELTIE